MASLLCIKCGYNLDGLPAPARCVQCPECGETTYLNSGGLRQLPLKPWLVALVAGTLPLLFAAVPLVLGGGRGSLLFFPLLLLGAFVIGPGAAFIIAHWNAMSLELHQRQTHWSARPGICALFTAADSIGLNIAILGLAKAAQLLAA